MTETVLGPKEQKIISDGAQGVVEIEVSYAEREASSLSPEMLKDLIDTAIAVEGLYDGLPQDIEWGFSGGVLHMLQSRPITLLPPDPEHPDIDLTWTPRPPARFLTRRQIVENMPDPICPLFEELYLTQGLGAESTYQWDHEKGAPGGPNYMTLNGCATTAPCASPSPVLTLGGQMRTNASTSGRFRSGWRTTRTPMALLPHPPTRR